MKLLVDSVVAFSYLPIRLVSIVGLITSMLGFGWAIAIVLRALISRDLTAGWPSLVAFLMIGFGITNMSLGIVAEYLWRTLNASRRRKAFIIERVVTGGDAPRPPAAP